MGPLSLGAATLSCPIERKFRVVGGFVLVPLPPHPLKHDSVVTTATALASSIANREKAPTGSAGQSFFVSTLPTVLLHGESRRLVIGCDR
jgi:hypothetical protein